MTQRDNKRPTAQEAEKLPASNAWSIHLGVEAHLDGFSITVDHVSSDLRGVREGDALLIVGEGSGIPEVLSFARIYRVPLLLLQNLVAADAVERELWKGEVTE